MVYETKKSIKINPAKSAGFCFGVKRAITMAFELARSDWQIEMLGDIVHNEDVVKTIEKSGIKKIKHLKNGKNKTLLIRAHGAPAQIFQKAKRWGYKIVDATCPMVHEIHRIAKKMELTGRKIIIIGDKKHDEVKGIEGQLKNKAIIIDNIKNILPAQLERIKSAAVIVQSTQNLEKVEKIIKTLKKHIANLKVFNTICRPTRIKQKEMKIMPLKNDVMIIIGSKTSANTKRLYELSKSLNKRSFWIQSKKEIKAGWFKNTKNVGITAGASTPDSITKDVINFVDALSYHNCPNKL